MRYFHDKNLCDLYIVLRAAALEVPEQDVDSKEYSDANDKKNNEQK